MEYLPSEIIIEIFHHVDSFTLLTRVCLVCRRFDSIVKTTNPRRLMDGGLTPSLWLKALEFLEDRWIYPRPYAYTTICNMKRVSRSFSLLISSETSQKLDYLTYRGDVDPLEGLTHEDTTYGIEEALTYHPFLTRVYYSLAEDEFFFRGRGNSLKLVDLDMEVLNDNATSPPSANAGIDLTGTAEYRYQIPARSIFFDKTQDEDERPRMITIRDVMSAIRILFKVEPLHPFQYKYLFDEKSHDSNSIHERPQGLEEERYREVAHHEIHTNLALTWDCMASDNHLLPTQSSLFSPKTRCRISAPRYIYNHLRDQWIVGFILGLFENEEDY